MDIKLCVWPCPKVISWKIQHFAGSSVKPCDLNSITYQVGGCHFQDDPIPEPHVSEALSVSVSLSEESALWSSVCICLKAGGGTWEGGEAAITE